MQAAMPHEARHHSEGYLGPKDTVPNKTGGKFSCSKVRACVEIDSMGTLPPLLERGEVTYVAVYLLDSQHCCECLSLLPTSHPIPGLCKG